MVEHHSTAADNGAERGEDPARTGPSPASEDARAEIDRAAAEGPGASTTDRPPASTKRVSLHTVERLSVYRKILEELDRDGVEFIHSQQLASLAGVTPAQLRRDLASFGSFGDIGRGYNVYRLSRTIGRILGTDTVQELALVGVGDLGRALLSYRGLEERGFHIAVAFDIDPDKIGRVFAGRRCHAIADLETVLTQTEVRTAILASRREGLQNVVDRLVGAGVTTLLNCVPKRVIAPPGCAIEDFDIAAKLEKLSFLSHLEAGVTRS